MKGKLSFRERESLCLSYYSQSGPVYHACTSENYPLVFRSDSDFKIGMDLFAVCAFRNRQLRILAFELMTNHIHIVIIGLAEDIERFFSEYKKLLARALGVSLEGFCLKLHQISDLENLRNVIAYVNRNGAMVDEDVTVYSYQWGTNRFYFNDEAKLRFKVSARQLKSCDIREITHSRKYDEVKDVMAVDGYASPLSFCYISLGEDMFRSARHYFTKVSRHVESYEQIAKLIGESVYYTDDDLFQIVCSLSRNSYGCNSPTLLPHKEKVELAKTLRTEYNANNKQIQRMLKLDQSVLTALFGKD